MFGEALTTNEKESYMNQKLRLVTSESPPPPPPSKKKVPKAYLRKTSCQTLSNALEISKNITLIWRSVKGPMNSNNWFVVESLGRQPDWFLVIKLYKRLKIIFSRIFPQMGRRDIGLYFLINNCSSPVLKIGVTFSDVWVNTSLQYIAVDYYKG